MREVLAELKEWTGTGEDIAIATVVETWGSSPRPLGSRMVVTRSGKMAGSVSNGCIEGAVFEEAQKVLKSGQPKVAAFGVADDVAFEVGLACGGAPRGVLEPRAPGPPAADRDAREDRGCDPTHQPEHGRSRAHRRRPSR